MNEIDKINKPWERKLITKNNRTSGIVKMMYNTLDQTTYGFL